MPRVKPLGSDPYPGRARFSAEVMIAAKMQKKNLSAVAGESLMHRNTLAEKLSHPETFRISEIVSISKSTGFDPVDLFKILLGKE